VGEREWTIVYEYTSHLSNIKPWPLIGLWSIYLKWFGLDKCKVLEVGSGVELIEYSIFLLDYIQFWGFYAGLAGGWRALLWVLWLLKNIPPWRIMACIGACGSIVSNSNSTYRCDQIGNYLNWLAIAKYALCHYKIHKQNWNGKFRGHQSEDIYIYIYVLFFSLSDHLGPLDCVNYWIKEGWYILSTKSSLIMTSVFLFLFLVHYGNI
jgi:hypothetical protein